MFVCLFSYLCCRFELVLTLTVVYLMIVTVNVLFWLSRLAIGFTILALPTVVVVIEITGMLGGW